MSKSIPYILTDSSITVVVKGKPYTISDANASFNEVKNRLANEDFDGIEQLFDTGAALGSFTKGNVVVQDNAVLYKGQPVNNHLVDRILQFMRDGLPYKPLVNFLDNLMANPSFRAVSELYGFLEKSNLPITEDGCFLAFRKVTSDYKDFYTRTFDNSIGKTVEMTRNLVDEDKNRTCSYGLHFCSQSYLSCYHGGDGRVVIVKINPADVVAIPADYNNAKGRCCKYIVISECENHDNGKDFGPLYQESPEKAFDDSIDQDDENDEDKEQNREDSFNAGFENGEFDAWDESPRDAQESFGTYGDDGMDEDAYLDGYEAGYDEGLEAVSDTKPAKPVVSDTTRRKLARLAKKQKRDANGRFI